MYLHILALALAAALAGSAPTVSTGPQPNGAAGLNAPFEEALTPAGRFGRDAVICSDPQDALINCGTGEGWARVGVGASNFGGAGLGWEAGADAFALLGQGPWALQTRVETWGHFNGLGAPAGGLPPQGEAAGTLELGLALGLPSYARTHLTPLVALNGASLLVGNLDGSNLLDYSPNLEVGVLGAGFGLAAAGGYAFFAGDNKLARLVIEDGLDFAKVGSAPFGRAQGFLDLPLASSMTLRASVRVEAIHQSLDVAGVAFGTRDIVFGRGELLLRSGHLTLGPSFTFFAPQREPFISSSSGYRGTLPETSVLFLFGA